MTVAICEVGFQAEETSIEGLMVIKPKLFVDQRGYFMESFRKRDFAEMGVDVEFVQENQSKSKKGTLRGLHFQKNRPQAKLVRAVRGSVFDVAVDLRRESPTFGRWQGVILDSEVKNMFYVPAGFAHGFLALTEDAEFSYKCSEYYDGEDEGGLYWNDPDIGIEWPLASIGWPLLSEKDRRLPRLRELDWVF